MTTGFLISRAWGELRGQEGNKVRITLGRDRSRNRRALEQPVRQELGWALLAVAS